jgi:hypothetical protein
VNVDTVDESIEITVKIDNNTNNNNLALSSAITRLCARAKSGPAPLPARRGWRLRWDDRLGRCPGRIERHSGKGLQPARLRLEIPKIPRGWAWPAFPRWVTIVTEIPKIRRALFLRGGRAARRGQHGSPLNGGRARTERRAASLLSALAQRRRHRSARFLQMGVSHGLRASISSLSLVYSVWKTNRALKTRITVKKSPVDTVLADSRRQSVPLVVGQSSLYKTTVDPPRARRWTGSQVCLQGRISWPADRGPSRKGLRETADSRREQQNRENRPRL